MALLIGLLPAIIPVCLWLIETFVMNKTQDAESRKMFLDVATKLRALGVKNAKSRFESAAQQSDAGNAEWDEREKGNKDAKDKPDAKPTKGI